MYMKKIEENFCGYIRVEDDTYTYNVSDNIVTLLPAQSDVQKRYDSLYHIESQNTKTSESFCQGGAWIFFILLTQILSLLLPE